MEILRCSHVLITQHHKSTPNTASILIIEREVLQRIITVQIVVILHIWINLFIIYSTKRVKGNIPNQSIPTNIPSLFASIVILFRFAT